ncbi:MAG: DMT family transporter [Pseudomonadota bacterium]
MSDNSANGRGIALMLAAMALFALADLAIKLATGRLAQPQIIFVVGLGGTLTFVTLALLRRETLFPPEVFRPIVLARNLTEIVGVSTMIVALGTTPLTIVGAILQASPLVVMAGGALFLGETIGWRRWSAAVVGFLGVLIVLRPWNAGVSPGAILAVIAMVCVSLRDILNRGAPASLPTSVLAAHGLASLLVVGLLWSLLGPGALLPGDPPWLLILAIVASGTGAYFAITASVRAAPVSVVAPFRYSRLLFLAAFGILILDEEVTWALVLGSALIIGSGLYVLARERRIAATP